MVSQKPASRPLLPDQLGIWLDQEGSGAACAYNIGGAIWMDAALDVATFQAALNTVVTWHDALRLSFETTDAGVIQQTVPSLTVPLKVVDCSTEADPEAAARQRIVECLNQPFDLTRPGLFRFELLRVAERRWCLLNVYSHLICDGWAISLITRQVLEAYATLLAGGVPQRPLGGQWIEHVEEEQVYYESERCRQDAAYWLEIHRSPSPPLFSPRTAGRRGSQIRQVSLARDRYARLIDFAKAQGVTANVLWIAAIYACFARAQGQWDLSIGIPTLNRRTARDKQTVGLFTTENAVRCRYAPDLTFGALLRQIQAELRRGYRHQRYALAELNRNLGLAVTGRRQVFDISFSFETANYGSTVDGVHTSAEAVVNRAILDPLAIFVRDYAGNPSVQIDFAYNLEYLDAATVDLLTERFTTLLDALPDCAETPLAELPLMPDAERRRVIDDFNAAAPQCAPPVSVVEAFEAQVSRTPHSAAVVFGNTQLSYAELNASANRVARRLKESGVESETLVAVCVGRSELLVAALLGILKAGGAYVPLDPSYPCERLAFMLADSGARVAVTAAALPDGLTLPSQCRLLDLNAEASALAALPSGDLPDKPDAASLAYVIYTSGSTGKPKGVAITHGALAQFLAASIELQLVRSGDRLLAVTPPSFDIAGLELFGPLLVGGTVIVAGQDEARDGDALAQRFAAVRPTVMQATPATWRMLLASGWQPCSGTRLLCGGEALAADLAEELLVGGRLYNLYGPTEATIWATAKEVTRPLDSAVVSIGRPFPRTRAYVLDERMSPVGIGVIGELWLGGGQLARGYLGQPALTAEKFVADPFGPPGSRLYRTGDLARWRPNGELEFLGRLDHQIKIRGHRIEPDEIAASLRSHAEVRDAVVVARSSSAGPQLVAYFTGTADPELLRKHMESLLPAYMVPQAIVPLEALPLTPNGKVDRKALPAPPAPTANAESFHPPATPTEKDIAKIWEDLLGCGPVSRTDSFFRLGGNSLLCAKVLLQIRRRYGVRVQMTEFFAGPTVEQLARLVDAARHSQPVPASTGTASIEFPCAPAQEGMWLARRDVPDATTYSVTFASRLEGHPSAERVREALRLLLARHEALRIVFHEREGQLTQSVFPEIEPALTVHDSRDFREIVQRELQRPFDLEHGSLARFHLCRNGCGADLLLGHLDHLVVDGTSIAILRSELSAILAGREAELPPVPVGYTSLCAKLRSSLEGERGRVLRDFWRSRLERPALEPLPSDPGDAPGGRRLILNLDPAMADALESLSRTQRITPTMVWLSVVSSLLARYKTAGQAVAVATPFAARPSDEFENAVGCFANVMPLRIENPSSLTFSEVAAAVKAEMLSVLQHQEYPFSWLTRDAAAKQGEDTPLYDAVAQLEPFEPEFHGLQSDQGADKFPLHLTLLNDRRRAMAIALEYEPRLYSPERIDRLATHLLNLIQEAASRPDVPVRRLQLLSAEETRQVTAEFNTTASAYQRDKSLAELFRATAQEHADHVAVVHGAQLVSYGELDRQSDALARGLLRAGVTPGTTVALAIDRGVSAIAATLAVVKAGAVYLPLDASLPPALTSRLMQTTGASLIVADARGRKRLAQIEARVLDVQSLAVESGDVPTVNRTGSDAAYVMFTSGSSGEAKGVVVPHRAVARLVVNAGVLSLAPHDVIAQAAPLGFDASTLEIWAPLLAGARTVIVDEEAALNPAIFSRTLEDANVTVMFLTTSLFNRLADDAPRCFRPLRRLIVGGESASIPHLRKVMATCPRLELFNGYGPTENTTFTTLHRITPEDLAGVSVPIGCPIANTQVLVLDEVLQPVPIGVWGELCAAGDGLALGYAGREQQTAQAFVTLDDGRRVYRTGDLARWRADGVLEFGGRRDGQVKLRGRRIETEAVETALCAQPGIRDAAVVVERETLVAVIASDAAEEAACREALAQVVPAYMVPERFVVVRTLPVTPNGKKDCRAAAALAAVEAEKQQNAPGRAPAPGAETLVARLFAEVFGEKATGTIDAESDFFHLGGHSLLAMRLAGLIEEETGARPLIRDILAARTVAGIAALLHNTAPAEMIPLAGGRTYPLSSGQARLWVLQRLHAASGVYNVPMALDLEGELDLDRLRRALTALEERHHALRLRLTPSADDPSGACQTLAAPGALQLQLVDLSASLDPLRAADERLSEELARPFQLERDPLARAILMKLGPQRWRLMMVLHHSVCDGWSLPILLRDLEALYAGHPLTPLARGYEDFAAWQHHFLQSPESKQLLEHWRNQLTPLPEPLALPLDHHRPAVRRGRGALAQLSLNAETNRLLSDLAGAANATPFMVLLAVLQVLLHRHTGQTDLSLGTLSAGRDRAELADVVGFFVNTLVLRQTIDPSVTFRTLLDATRSTLLDAVAGQDCPFEAVVDAVNAPRDTSRNPLFDVLAVWQDTEPKVPTLLGANAKIVDFPFPYSKFDLEFYFQATAKGVHAHVMFDTDLFAAGTIDALLSRFQVVAAAALRNPDLPLAELPWISEGEARQVVHGFNATETELPVRQTVPQPFLAQVARNGEAKAVITSEGTLTYTAFARRAAHVASELARCGVKPGSVVAVCARRSLDLLAAIHGILLAGAAYVPIDPDYPAARRTNILDDLGEPTIVAAADCASLFPPDCVLVPDAGEAEPINRADNPDALAYVIFTSGSTGRPKGVGIEHHSVLNRILWMQSAFPIGPGDVILQKTTVCFDVSVWELFWWSWTGAAVALPPVGAEKDPAALADAIERFGVTVMHFVPSMLAAFLAAIEDGRVSPDRLRRLRYVFASGEALDVGLVERFNRLLHEPYRVELHNLYGPTEATVDVTWQPCSPWNGSEVVPIGKPIANTHILILDQDRQPVPVGVPGEIYIGGPQVARGYINRPELTAERFIADPICDGGRLYRTGDGGRWRPDGTVEYLGRLDGQVKIRGFRIECGEVEHVLESHPSVEHAAVVPVTTGGLTELHAYVVGASAEAGALRAHLRSKLPDYMVPARFFRLQSLPLTSNGKLDRKRLSGQPLDAAAGAESATPLETELMAIWQDVLGHSQFGLRDGFFDVGGNSLLLLRLHARLDARWPGLFSVASLFACSNITEQARRIEQAGPVKAAESKKSALATHPGAIAIVGMAVRLADFEDLDTFWRDLASGADRVQPLPEKRESQARALLAAMGWEQPVHFHQAAYLDDICGFDPARFRMAPADAALVDPEQRILYETSLRALEDAGYGGTALDGHKVGVFIGAGPSPSYRLALKALVPEKLEQVFTLNVPSNAATRLSFLHDWSGPAMLVDTACSAALTALHQACNALRNGECEAALVGGARVMPVPPEADLGFAIDSSNGRTRAFAAGADGTGMGEGAAVFVLKPLERAQADGDAIYAVILGSAVNQDGASSGMAAPNPVAQAAVIRAAADSAGIELASLSYIEAHGTGTDLGDPIEVEGLTRAFAGTAGDVALGSVKGNYGHLDSTAGALGLAKAVLCLRHKQAPPQPFFEAPNPRIDFDHAPAKVARQLTPLVGRDCPLRAGISSFGLSGINSHVIIEEAPAPAPATPSPADGWYVVALSAGSQEALRRYRDLLRASIAAADVSITDVAHTLATGRTHLRHRFAVVVRDRLELLSVLTAGDAETAEVTPQRGTRPVVPAFAGSMTAARAAVDAYLAGADLSWPAEAGAARRLHLPPAPFTRQSCWPTVPHICPMSADVGVAATRCLGAPVSTPEGQVFAVPVHAPDFWPAAEHRLEDRPTLVGMAFPCLVAEAARSLGLPEAEIRELRWKRKLRPDELDDGGVSLQLKHGSDGSWQAALGGRSRTGDWMEFASAQVSTLVDPPMGVDIAALRARCPVAVPLAPFSTSSGPVTVSERWNCRAEVWTSQDRRLGLALVRLPEAYRGDVADYRLHPAMLDVAASLALDGIPRVPAGCTAIRVFDSLPADALAYVIRRQIDDDALEADISLYDPVDGRLRVALVGMRFLTLHGGTPMPLSTLVWQPVALPKSANTERVWVAGTGALAQELAQQLGQSGRLAGRAQDAAEILACGATDIVLAVDSGEPAWNLADLLRQLMAGLKRKLRLLVVSRRAFSRDSEDATPTPDAALYAGLVLSAAQEEPMLALRYLDVDESSLADFVAAEFAAFEAADVQPLAMLRQGRRYQRELTAVSGATAHWPTSGCCVVTGGTGGLALSLAQEFSSQGELALALLSRTGEIGGDDAEARERREKLAALLRSGYRVRMYACDVANRDSLEATLARIRAELGAITAVVHAAGVADSGFLVNRRREAFDAVLAAKVDGARNLDALTRTDPVEAFVLFASVTGLAGAPGQTSYAAANAWLDTFADWRRRQGRPALSIDWCTLSDIGMAARHGADKLGGVAVSPAELPALWRQILATSAVQVAVVDASKAKLATPAPTAAPSSDPVPAVEKKARPTGVLESALATIWAEILGYESVSADDDYFDLGGDSLSGMQIVTRIRSDLGYTLKVPDLLEAGTVKALAQKLRGTAASSDAEIEAAPAQSTYPLGWEQRDVLRAEASAEMGTAFNLPNVLELPASLTTERLHDALTELVSRYEILRTRFRQDNDDWVMEVLPPAPVTLPQIDLTDAPDAVAACNALVQPHEWRSSAPVRFALLRLPEGRRALLFDLHHSLADGLSLELLVADLAALCAGKKLPAPARHYKDYAWWSRNGEGARIREAARNHWLAVYKGALPRVDLPSDRPRPPVHTWRCGTVSFEVDAGVMRRLREFAAERRVTPFVVVLSAWAALLEKLTASEDLVIGVPVDNRDRAGLEKMPGMMVSLLPLRLAVRNHDGIGALLEHVQSVHADAMRHRAFGLGSLLEELAPPASPDRTWLSEVTLSYMNFAEGVPDDAGFRTIGLSRESIKGDLSIFVRDLPERMQVAVEYYTGLFDAERIERMGAGFTALLSAMVNTPVEAKVADLPSMDVAEAARVHALESGAQMPLPSSQGLAALFTTQAHACPDAVAIEDASGSWTYRELSIHANGVAHRLIEAGVRPGDLVVLAMERSIEAIAALLGIVMAGAGYVPLDPGYPAERKCLIATDAGARVAIADTTGRAALAQIPGLTLLDSAHLIGHTADEPPAIAWRDDPDNSPAYLMYTSGSTGRPKGVLVPQRAVVRLVFADDDVGLDPADCVLQAGPLAFDASTWEIWGTLLKGARLAIASKDEILDPSALASALDRYCVTALFLTTSLFNRQVDHDPGCFEQVRVLLTGGEAMSSVHASRLLQACPRVRLVNVYGPTENTTFTTFHRVRPGDAEQSAIPIGRPIAANRVAILDAAGRRVPLGVWGEICAGGPGLADGYWKRPELTRERFIVDPEQPGERLYRTGDVGRWRADGVIEFRGRLDTQIKLRGIRIELDEIEQAINRHPAVARSAVQFANNELTACLVLNPDGGALTDTAMRAWLKQSLPAALVPAHWVSVPDIPVNANGKADRERLASLIRSASPLGGTLAAEPPRTDAERCVAEAFSEVLGLPVNDRNASFLDLGGHSLQAIRVVNRIAQRTGVRLRMADFLADSSLEAVALQIEEASGLRESLIPRAPEASCYPASHAQQRLYLLHRMDPESAAYNMAFVFRCDGSLDVRIFVAALGALVERHETLRTAFEEIDGAIVQRVLPDVVPPVEVDDLRTRPDAWAQALRLARAEVSVPFDLSHAPLVRARILQVSPDETVVLLLLDHICADGWSSRILVRELGALYQAALTGTESGLTPLAVTYKDYAVWQNAQDWKPAAAYWRQRLGGVPDCIVLPSIRPLPEVQSYRGASCRRRVPVEVMDGLRQLAREQGVTLAAVGMAIFAALLYRLTRQRDMVVGMGVAGRDRAELEGQIGFFVNVLPIRLELDEEAELDDLIRQTHTAMVEALDRRDYPFDLLVRDVAPRRQANRQPLVNVVFEYQRFGSLKAGNAAGLPLGAAKAGPADSELDALIESHTAKHDMILFFQDEDEEGELLLEHDTDILDTETAARWLEFYSRFATEAARSTAADTTRESSYQEK